jgi:protocatechuate 3,4-dioxygenase beta subunit
MPTLESDRRSLLGRLFALPAALFLTARRASGTGKDVCSPTQADFLGPMYEPGAPRRSVIAGPDEPGERLRVAGTVFGPDCRTPLPKTLLDVWQADAKGEYHDAGEQYRLRGQILTDARGRYEIDTVRPGGYGGRPAHIHVTVSAPGHQSLTTQIYFQGDPVLDHDSCGRGCNSDDPHRIIALGRKAGGFLGTFDVVLKASRA